MLAKFKHALLKLCKHIIVILTTRDIHYLCDLNESYRKKDDSHIH